MNRSRVLVCSFHDLSPHSRAACDRFLDMLASTGTGKASLLTVPRWHGGPTIDGDAAFVGWLREREMEGHEVCLHGWEHRAGQIRRNPLSLAVGRLYTAGEGEFHELDRLPAGEKIRSGLAVMSRAGFAPRGFVAPAWLLSRPSMDVLREGAFLYTCTLTRIYLLQTGQELVAPALSLSSRSAWRRLASRCVFRLGERLLRKSPILRIAAHPADFDHPAMARTLETVIRSAGRKRTALAYGDLARVHSPGTAA
jgi:predicted deacetylase